MYYRLMKELDPILPKIRRFIEKNAVPETMFGLRAAGDPNLLDDLKQGRELRRATRQKVADYMANYEVGK